MANPPGPAEGPSHAAGLAAREAMFRALLDAAPDGMVVVDREGRIVLANRQAEALFGVAGHELIGRPVEVLLPEAYRATHEEQRARYHAAPRTRPMGTGLELLARRGDGSEFPVEISLSPLETGDGRLGIAAGRHFSGP